MQFIRNILILGEKKDFSQEIKKILEGLSKKIAIQNIYERNEISSQISEKKINAVFIHFENKPDVLYALRLLGMYKAKTNPQLEIFFTSSNFETFQSVINEVEEESIEIAPWPVDQDALANKMVDKLFDRKLSKQVVTNSNSVLNVDLEFIQVFIQATKKTLEEMCQVKEIKNLKPLLKNKMDDPIENGIASKIMISSEFFTGNFYAIFPDTCYFKIYENAVYEPITEINDENKDFAGELANIIYGQSKKVLSASGLNLDMAIPSVHPSSNVEAELVIVIPFESSVGKFYIAVAPGKL